MQDTKRRDLPPPAASRALRHWPDRLDCWIGTPAHEDFLAQTRHRRSTPIHHCSSPFLVSPIEISSGLPFWCSSIARCVCSLCTGPGPPAHSGYTLPTTNELSSQRLDPDKQIALVCDQARRPTKRPGHWPRARHPPSLKSTRWTSPP